MKKKKILSAAVPIGTLKVKSATTTVLFIVFVDMHFSFLCKRYAALNKKNYHLQDPGHTVGIHRIDKSVGIDKSGLFLSINLIIRTVLFYCSSSILQMA